MSIREYVVAVAAVNNDGNRLVEYVEVDADSAEQAIRFARRAAKDNGWTQQYKGLQYRATLTEQQA